jgi:hypothetical protein
MFFFLTCNETFYHLKFISVFIYKKLVVMVTKMKIQTETTGKKESGEGAKLNVTNYKQNKRKSKKVSRQSYIDEKCEKTKVRMHLISLICLSTP